MTPLPSAGHYTILTYIRQTKKAEKAKSAGAESAASAPTGPQRFSTTSGDDNTPQGKKTWTVGDTVDETTHRGGKKVRGKKGKKPKAQDWGTGVNAIPLG